MDKFLEKNWIKYSDQESIRSLQDAANRDWPYLDLIDTLEQRRFVKNEYVLSAERSITRENYLGEDTLQEMKEENKWEEIDVLSNTGIRISKTTTMTVPARDVRTTELANPQPWNKVLHLWFRDWWKTTKFRNAVYVALADLEKHNRTNWEVVWVEDKKESYSLWSRYIRDFEKRRTEYLKEFEEKKDSLELALSDVHLWVREDLLLWYPEFGPYDIIYLAKAISNYGQLESIKQQLSVWWRLVIYKKINDMHSEPQIIIRNKMEDNEEEERKSEFTIHKTWVKLIVEQF